MRHISAEQLYRRAQRAVQSTPPRWEEFFKCLRSGSDLGFPQAQADLGEWYLEGFKQRSGKVLLARSPRRGRVLLQAAADAGISSAFFPLGVCFCLGQGGEKSMQSALYWYRLAARDGHPSAAFNAAMVYRDLGDRAGQLRWLRRAIELGDDDAVTEFGRLVLFSRGRASDTQRRRALWQLHKLARSKSSEASQAMLVLADAYEAGAGVEVSPRRAAEWRKKAERARKRRKDSP